MDLENRKISAGEIVIPLSRTLDLIDNRLINHHRRVAYIASAIGREMNLSSEAMKDLVIASSLHDLGAINEKTRDGLCKFDTDDVSEHAETGYRLLRKFTPFSKVAEIIKWHHASYDSARDPAVPHQSFIIHLADRVDILLDKNEHILDQVEKVYHILREKSGKKFSPEIFEAFRAVSSNDFFWLELENSDISAILKEKLNSENAFIDIKGLYTLAEIFSRIIDFKSSFTATHSAGVAAVSGALSSYFDFDGDDRFMMELAGLFHDIGKVAVPEEILNKEGSLSPHEFNIMKRHVYYTHRVFSGNDLFDKIRKWASSHHEMLDGSGYPFRLKGNEIDTGSRILVVADKFTALMEDRPYRSGLSGKEAMKLIQQMSDRGLLCRDVVSVLNRNFDDINNIRLIAQRKEFNEYLNLQQDELCRE